MNRAPSARAVPQMASSACVVLGVVLLAGLLPATARAAEPPSGGTPGLTFAGSAGVTETTAAIMARAAKEPPVEIEKETEPKKIRPDRSKLPQNPDARPVSQWPPLPDGGQAYRPDAPFSPQTLGTTFLGATLSGVNPTGAFPPDSMGAVGPAQYIVVVNGRIVSFNKTTGVADGVLNATTNTFFTSVRNGSGTSDPRIRFDRLTQRWIVVIINVSTPNRILIAVSDEASAGVVSASTVWSYYYLQINTAPPTIASTCLMDYPTLGVDANALYIGGNNFCGSPQSFHSTDGWVIRKSSVLSGGPIVATVFRALGTGSTAGLYTPQGVDNYDPAATEGYFVAVDTVSYGTLFLRRVSTPGGTPTISANLTVANAPATSGPLNAPHLGNTNGTNGQLDALDDRLFAAHLRNGKIFSAHNVGVDASGIGGGTATRTATRWYEISGVASPGTPTVSQFGTVWDPAASNPVYYSIPSIMVSGQGHAALGFTTAGTNARVNAGTVGRLADDTPGTTGTPIDYTSSTTAYNPPSDTGNTRGARRWGDYSYTSLDPSDDMTMWTIQQFCNATNSYGVQVVRLLAPPPATPAACSPALVAQGASNANVVVTGTSASGSGFFDPIGTCATCPNHVAATVSGTGVTVNSVTYGDPTHLTLNLTVAPGAAVGARDLTVTNPDGQVVTGTGILTINGSGCPAITGTVSGGGTVCPGTPMGVTVTVSGGTPPYTVTLDNGGGIQTGPGPAFVFPVGVVGGTSTTYSVASLADSASCFGSGVGSATVTVLAAPAQPAITAPAWVAKGSAGHVGTVTNPVAGLTYTWSLVGGTITGGQGTSQVTFSASSTPGPASLSVVAALGAGCPSLEGTAAVNVYDPDGSTRLFTLGPCRLVDTRNPAGPLGGPAIGAGQTRVFSLTGVCGIPAGAVAVILNVTGVNPAAAGSFALFPGNGAFADTTIVSFEAGKTRAAVGTSKLATDGTGTLSVRNTASATVDLILDVSGYFAPVAPAGGKATPSEGSGADEGKGEVK